MPEIRPFPGILYNPERVTLDEVVAPPYDVISPARQQELYDASPFNCVRIVLGREENRYVSAANCFTQWLSERILVRDETPAIYVLSQLFRSPEGKHLERVGFIAACKLEDFGKGSIFPHETTFSNPKEDRFRLLQATGAMFSQIFALYSDPEHRLEEPLREAMRRTPALTADQEGVLNIVWRLTDRRSIESIAAFMAGEKVFVADGHHRYETALLYRDSLRLKQSEYDGTEPFNFVPMYFGNMDSSGLIILPTHRILRALPESAPGDILRALQARCVVDPLSSADELMASLRSHPRRAFGLVLPAGPGYFLLSVRDAGAGEGPDVPAPLRGLDVLLLHQSILRDALGISDDDQESRRYLEYEKDPVRAIDAVQSGHAQAAFLLNPTSVDQVRAVAEAGYTMPQKSTYFDPKLLSGLVSYSFTDPALA